MRILLSTLTYQYMTIYQSISIYISISGNVKMTRPAHDAWGIKKITFNFCDDFLLKGMFC